MLYKIEVSQSHPRKDIFERVLKFISRDMSKFIVFCSAAHRFEPYRSIVLIQTEMRFSSIERADHMPNLVDLDLVDGSYRLHKVFAVEP